MVELVSGLRVPKVKSAGPSLGTSWVTVPFMLVEYLLPQNTIDAAKSSDVRGHTNALVRDDERTDGHGVQVFRPGELSRAI